MEETNYNIEYIDQYLSGALSESELSSFEQKMENDLALQNTVKEVIRAKSASYLLGKEEWKEKMNQKFDAHLKPRKFNFWPLLVASIAALMLVLAGIWWFQSKTHLTPEQVFAQNYETPIAPEYRGENIGLDSLLAIAYGNYNSRNFEEALVGFDRLVDREDLPNREEVLFHKGITLLELNKEQEALDMLAQVRGEQYGESAQYFEALVLLKQGEVQGARKALEKLIEFDGTWKTRAKEILVMLGNKSFSPK